MVKERTLRLNSLLQEVLSEVIHREIHHNPLINEKISITRVEITADLHNAKVFVSILGTDPEKQKVLEELNHLAPQITHIASRKVRMRFFPYLVFQIDTGLEKQMRIQELLTKISDERESRSHDSDT